MSRFLAMETDPDEDGPLYLIEREEKLSQVICTSALVDQHHCRGPRSLRWDLLSVRLSRGILHAKVSLMVWSRTVRVLITSANLTEDGYRRNLEVFGVFDYREGGNHPIDLLYKAIDFLHVCADHARTQTQLVSPPLERVQALLDRVRLTPLDWGISDEDSRRKGMAAYPVFVQPGGPHVLESMSRLWPHNVPPVGAHVISPFFDPPDAPNLPAKEIWKRLRKRGNAWVFFYLDAEEGLEGNVVVHAPESLIKAEPNGRPGVETRVHRLDVEGTRPLHAKGISFKDERWSLFMIGSSNFTCAGLGLPSVRNLEANVAFCVDSNKQPQAAESLDSAIPPNLALDLATVKWEGSLESEDDPPGEEAVLPDVFGTATYMVDKEGQASVEFSFSGVPQPGWSITQEDEEKIFLTEKEWTRAGQEMTVKLKWTPIRPPSGFWVSWENNSGRAWWPVNVESLKTLPPPDELKSLSLEILIDILTSARPLYRVLSDYLKRRKDLKGLPSAEILFDPHKRVDTSRFLLQRTRRISWALSALRERLERPVATEEGLQWRFNGPVGVRALITALLNEGQSQEERTFLLSELALELFRVKPVSVQGCLPVSRVGEVIQEIILELQGKTEGELDGKAVNLTTYVHGVFEAVLK